MGQGHDPQGQGLDLQSQGQDHNFVLKDNQGPRPKSTFLIIGRNIMDDSSVAWKYLRPVDSVRAAVAHQGQDMSLKAWTEHHNFVLKSKAKDIIPGY